MNFLKAVQRDKKVSAVRAKMRKADSARKQLSREYERAIKAAAVKLKKRKPKKQTSKRKRR
ncbi:MAG: hypothetical protein L6Q47_02230 [Ignavibacteriaceae bacterium]|nr:hypothetical protein [Ignavibacteriaceae bacterium]